MLNKIIYTGIFRMKVLKGLWQGRLDNAAYNDENKATERSRYNSSIALSYQEIMEDYLHFCYINICIHYLLDEDCLINKTNMRHSYIPLSEIQHVCLQQQYIKIDK
jgi:hypothetical protein